MSMVSAAKSTHTASADFPDPTKRTNTDLNFVKVAERAVFVLTARFCCAIMKAQNQRRFHRHGFVLFFTRHKVRASGEGAGMHRIKAVDHPERRKSGYE
ncbi:MAG: hypothetical protein QM689_08280 [Oscillospiraceae bacterium]